MKTKTFIYGATALFLVACTNELDTPSSLMVGTTPMQIQVQAHTTKALVESNTLPAGKIGVKLVDATETTYDSQTYNNIFYNTTDGTTWSVDPAHPVMLSATTGKAYAYYPYNSAEDLDFTRIPIETAATLEAQNDYMFGSAAATGLSNSNAMANFTLDHAMAIINYVIVKGTYTGTGAITSVSMKSLTASNAGTMNVIDHTVTATNANCEFTNNTAMPLTSASGKFVVVPVGGDPQPLNFTVVMDGQTYTVQTPELTVVSGQVYKYTLRMNSTGLTINQVNVIRWDEVINEEPMDAEFVPDSD